jgi:hypothetical protein
VFATGSFWFSAAAQAAALTTLKVWFKDFSKSILK